MSDAIVYKSPFAEGPVGDPAARVFVTSIRVTLQGGHEHIGVWLRNQSVGELIVTPGDGELLAKELGLKRDPPPTEEELTQQFKDAFAGKPRE
jgi:hypothetical protein